MLMVFALLAALLGYVLLAARRFRWRPEETLLPVTSAIVAVLFVFAIGGLLRPGAFLILTGGWAALALAIWQRRHEGRQAAAEILTPGLVLFVAASVLLRWKLQPATFSQWDEFSHWGVITKWLDSENALATYGAAVILPQYPPASALWHYLVTRVVPYSEGAAYFAHALLLLVPFVLPLGHLSWRRWPLVLTAVLFAYFGAFTLGHGYQSLLVDHVMSAYFGGAVLWYVLGDGTRARLIAMVPMVFTLPLWKEAGLVLAGIVCAVPAVTELARVLLARRNRASRPARRLLVPALVIVPGAAILANVTWGVFVQAHFKNVELRSARVIRLQAAALFSDRRSERERIVLAKFTDALSHASAGNGRLGALINGMTNRAGLRPIVSNGDFASADLEAWQAYGTTALAVDGQRLRLTRGSGADSAAQVTTTIRTRVGRRYAVSCTYELGTGKSATIRVRARQDALAQMTDVAGSGRLAVEFTAAKPETEIDLWVVVPMPGGYGYFDDVRVFEIAAPPVTGPADAPRDAAQQAPPVSSVPPVVHPTVENGTFDSGLDGWRPFGTTRLDVVKGRLRAERAGGSDTAVQATTTIETAIGQRYRVSCTYVLETTRSATLRVREGPKVLAQADGTKPSGRLSVTFTATATATDIDIWLVSPAPDGHGYFDDVKAEAVDAQGRKPAASDTVSGPAPRQPLAKPVAGEVKTPHEVPTSMYGPVPEWPLTSIAWISMLAVLGALLPPLASKGDERLTVAVTSVVLTGGVVVYLLSLLAAYFYALSEQDARDLTSFNRYVALYFLGWALVVFGVAIRLSTGRRRRASTAIAAGLAVVMLAAAPRASADWLLDEPYMLSERKAVQTKIEQVRQHVPKDRGIWIVWQNTQGFEFWMLRYELAPRATNYWDFSFGPPYRPGDIWTSNFSDAEFVRSALKYDYLFLARSDAQFWTHYGHLFDPASRGLHAALFRIHRGPGGAVSFELITPL